MEKEPDVSNLKGWEETQRQLDEAADTAAEQLRRFEHRLPPVLYHITTRQNAERILREGLAPSLRMEGDKEVVSLTDDIAFGKRVVAETQRGEKPEDLVVLRIDTAKLDRELAESFLEEKNRDVMPSALQEKLKIGNPQALEEYLHEVHYEGEITPNAIAYHRAGIDPNADWHRKRDRSAIRE